MINRTRSIPRRGGCYAPALLLACKLLGQSTTNPPAPAESPIVLSPFEVTENNRGYYSSSTMSGTRLNSKVEDLASAITVVTKQQMSDFALLDINDVFLYEASTEGSGTYSDITANADGVPVDNVQLNPNNANRIRGVSSANLSFGNFQTSGRVPVDPINIEAVEINRGPNSSVFGLGNAGGTVNLQPASANLGRNRSQVTARADSFDGWRTSLDLNRVLKKDVLAIRGSAVYQHDGFHLKPSGTNTTRLNGMVKYSPFKYTTISASYSTYRMSGNRPNTSMPLDGISTWQQAGRPTWDPVTATAHLNGRTLGPFGATSTGGLPTYYATTTSIRILSSMAIDGNGQFSLWQPLQATSSTTDPNASKQANSFFAITSPYSPRTDQPLWASDPVVSSKSVYDWSSINIAAMNWLRQAVNTSFVNVDQIVFDTPRQQLAFQAGFYREDAQSYARNIEGAAGSAGRIGYLNMDTNERLLNGQPNPFFMHPFLGVNAPGSTDQPLRNQTGRVQVAYKLDLRHEKGLLHWLGLHQLSGYGEYQDKVQRRIYYRDIIADDHPWLQAVPRATTNATQGGGSDIARNYFRYYVGDNVGDNVDYAPHAFAYGAYPYSWGNALTGAFKTESATIGQGIAFDSTGGTGNTHQVVKTQGVVLQSFLLRDRVVTTLGLRKDKNYNKFGVPALFLPDGTLDWRSWNRWAPGDWTTNEGTTKTAGIVVKALPWLNLHANVSNSFQPAAAAYDLYLRSLPDPTGKGKDYGFTLNLMDGKLVARVNQYETKQINARAGNTAAARVRAIDFDFASASTNKQNWLSSQATQWVTDAAKAKGQTLTPDQIITQISAIMGITPELYNAQAQVANSTIAETADVIAKGTEIELNYNPTNFWTAKLNVVKQESIAENLSPAVTQWIAERLPVWQKIIDPTTGKPWFTTQYVGATMSSAQFLASGVLTPLSVDKALEGKSKPQVRKYRANLTTSYRLAGLTDNSILKKFTVGGGLRWEDKGSIGFYGVEMPPAIVTALDPNRPIWDKAHLYADAFVGYRTRLFGKFNANFQLNVRNIQENGRLQAVNAYPDGTPWTYRIVDPRQFILSASFDL